MLKGLNSERWNIVLKKLLLMVIIIGVVAIGLIKYSEVNTHYIVQITAIIMPMIAAFMALPYFAWLFIGLYKKH